MRSLVAGLDQNPWWLALVLITLLAGLIGATFAALAIALLLFTDEGLLSVFARNDHGASLAIWLGLLFIPWVVGLPAMYTARRVRSSRT